MSNLPTTVKVSDGTDLLEIDASGRITVNLATNSVVKAQGSVIHGAGGAVGAFDGVPVMGHDYTGNAYLLKVDASGQLSIGASALPTGAATSAKQDTIIGHVDGIETLLGTIDADTSTLSGTVSGGMVQVSDGGSSLTVDDGGLTLSVDGTVSVQNTGGSVLYTKVVDATSGYPLSLRTDADTTTIASAISPFVMGWDGSASRVIRTNNSGHVKTEIQAGTANIGDVDIASIAAGTTRIGKVIVTDDTNDLTLFKNGDSTTSKAGVLIAGANGTTAQHIRVDASGELQVDVNNAIDISDDYTRQLGIVKIGDGTDLLAVNADGSINVAVASSALPTGAATSANQSTIIGHLDGVEGLLTSIDTDVDTIAKAVGVSGSAVPANTMMVAGSDSGTARTVKVDSSGNVGIAGTVTANLSATDNAVLDAIEADTTTLAGAVSGTEMQTDVVTLPTGGGRTLKFYAINTAASGNTTIIAADASNKHKVISYVIVCKTAVDVKFNDGTVDLTGAMPLADNGGVSCVGNVTSHLFETAAVNRPLNINLSAAVQVSGHICILTEA